jgi:hypothetical protein
MDGLKYLIALLLFIAAGVVILPFVLWSCCRYWEWCLRFLPP